MINERIDLLLGDLHQSKNQNDETIALIHEMVSSVSSLEITETTKTKFVTAIQENLGVAVSVNAIMDSLIKDLQSGNVNEQRTFNDAIGVMQLCGRNKESIRSLLEFEGRV